MTEVIYMAVSDVYLASILGLSLITLCINRRILGSLTANSNVPSFCKRPR